MKTKMRKTWNVLINKDIYVSILITLVVVAIGLGLAYENNKVVPVNPVSAVHYVSKSYNALSFMSDWDGPHYLAIAQHGYSYKDLTNFFPLYPALIHLVNILIGSVLTSGLIVSWVFLVGAVYFYLKIVKLYYKIEDNHEALRATLFFVLFPTGVFLLATYTESLFAFLALSAIYYALKKQFIPAALLTMLSTATHINGLFVLALVILLMLEEKLKPIKIAATAAISSLGLISYMIYQKIKFNNYFEFVGAQKNHGWFNFGFHHFIDEFVTLNGLFLILIIISTIYWWNRRKSFSIYALFYAFIVFIGGRDLSGLARYSLMVFPLQFMLYECTRSKKTAYAVILSLSSILWAFFLLRYAGGYTGG